MKDLLLAKIYNHTAVVAVTSTSPVQGSAWGRGLPLIGRLSWEEQCHRKKSHAYGAEANLG